MSFLSLLTHPLTIIRTTFDDTEAERTTYGQPAQTTDEIEVVGLVQPKTATEMADSRSAGSEIADHTIFLLPMALYGSDVFEDVTGKRYTITGIRSFDFGSTPHLEVDAMAVVSVPVSVGGS